MEQEQAMMMGTSLLKTLALFMEEGGVFMWVIFATWALGHGRGFGSLSRALTL